MKSEFATLSDMVMSRGIAHSVLIREIHEVILAKFKQRYPKQPVGVAVVVDETSGEIRIFSGNKDITPEDFREEARSLARMVLIEKISESGTSATFRANASGPSVHNMESVWGWLTSLLFWGYNLYFFLFALGTANDWWKRLFRTGQFWQNISQVNLIEMGSVLLMLVVPLFAVAVVVKRKQLGQPTEKGKIFFLGEIPIVAILWLLAAVGSHAAIFIQFLMMTLLGIPFSLYFYLGNNELGKTWQKAALFIQAAAFLAVGYLVFLFTFFVPKIIGSVGGEIFGNIFYSSELLLIGPVVVGLTLLLISLPYLLLYTLTKALNQTARKVNDQKLNLVFTVVILVTAALAAWQPRSYKLLDTLVKVNQAYTFDGQETLVKQIYSKEKDIVQAIKAYQANRSKYIFSKNDQTGLDEFTNKLFLAAAYPLVYQGGDYSSYNLEQSFKYVFGHYSYENAASLPKQATNVKLAYRKYSLTTNPDSLAGKISIEEEYENTTYSQQEVIYEFSLPEGSVVTELNLGPNLEFPGVIAPRGAAQQTYQAQLQVRRDPALLEQIGPNWYRLRVFPVPAMNDMTTLKGKRQRVQWSYVTPPSASGFPTPNFYKKTNVFASGTTYLSQINNGQMTLIGNAPTVLSTNPGKDTLIPIPDYRCPDLKDKQISWAGATITLGNGGCQDNQAWMGITGKRIAILLDVSSSNKGTSVISEMRTIFSGKGGEFLDNNSVVLYKYNKYLADPIRLTKKNLLQATQPVYFGDSTQQVVWPNNTESADLVLMAVSPKEDLTRSTWLPFKPNEQVYVIANDVFPAVNTKLMAYLLQWNGGNKPNLVQAMNAWVEKTTNPSQIRMGNLAVNVTRPITEPLDLAAKPASGSADIDKALINGALLKMYLRNKFTDVTGNIDEMDKLNKFAQTAGTVTPFSSYIALVNEQQKQQLQNFSQSYNRYQEQQMVQNNQNIRNPVLMQTEDNWGGGENVFNFQMQGGPSIRGGGGGSNFGAITNPMMGATMMDGGGIGIGSILGGSGFVMLNIGVLGLGLVIYLLRVVRRAK